MGWDEYFMIEAFTSAMKSKDPDTQVGAVLAGLNYGVEGKGFNGAAQKYDDTKIPMHRPKDPNDPAPNKYDYMIHAEVNAILFGKNSGSYFGAYVTLHPCIACFNLLVQVNVKQVIWFSDYKSHKWNRDREIIKRQSEEVGVPVKQYSGPLERLESLIPYVRGEYGKALRELKESRREV